MLKAALPALGTLFTSPPPSTSAPKYSLPAMPPKPNWPRSPPSQRSSCSHYEAWLRSLLPVFDRYQIHSRECDFGMGWTANFCHAIPDWHKPEN